MAKMKRFTACLMAAVITLSLCTIVTPVTPVDDTNESSDCGDWGIAPCSDFGDIDYF